MIPSSRSTPISEIPTDVSATELAGKAVDFRLRMMTIVRETKTAVDATYDRYGRSVSPEAARAACTHRDQEAVQAYATCLAPHAEELLTTARRTLSSLPPARHTAAWWNLLDDLAVSHAKITDVLNHPEPPGSDAEQGQQSLVWPHLAFWAEHSYVATHLLEQPRSNPQPAEEEQQKWTQWVQAARNRGALSLTESWYAADGRQVTLAHLVHDDNNVSTVVALSGDPDGADWRVIGHYADAETATRALSPAVPPGVLRADSWRSTRPEPVPGIPLQDLIQDVNEGAEQQ